jgi:DNA-binding Xre family transcriptional regulator
MRGMGSTIAGTDIAGIDVAGIDIVPGGEEHGLVEGDEVVGPVVAEIEGVRLRLHARSLRGSMTLVEVARRADLNRDELSRLEKGETTQVRFSTLAKLIAVYDCSLEDLVEVERPQAEVPMYAAALAAIAEGRLPAAGPQRRTVRRPGSLDAIALVEESTFAPSEPLPRRRRRSPVGTVHQ